ncbi:MAG: hypothetical protein COZ17_13400 [Flavobacteriaceae bacterium CG_4_10_14_3_um_filter_33_47]|nr:MAG: hypothetical protein COZ17_13400 [Flavobacteriaceae bacterium CG_4_10_14_3_um_filter_33_47]PJB20531.1 MAG: hypothetical protein CO117_00675 [Flavobacteriaceae bacterium CG_4_9_14_3_um_filter_33_16]
MKQILFLSIFMLLTTAYSQKIDQNPSVEAKVIGVQTGLFGLWGYYETKLSPKISLRTELGLDVGLRQGLFTNNELVFALIPNLALEPRWYYSLERRVRKNRDVSNNTGFFLGLKARYYPDWFVISNEKNISVIESLDFIPKIGYRKVWNNHLSFESGFGIGKSLSIASSFWDTTAELTFRIGYNF